MVLAGEDERPTKEAWRRTSRPRGELLSVLREGEVGERSREPRRGGGAADEMGAGAGAGAGLGAGGEVDEADGREKEALRRAKGDVRGERVWSEKDPRGLRRADVDARARVALRTADPSARAAVEEAVGSAKLWLRRADVVAATAATGLPVSEVEGARTVFEADGERTKGIAGPGERSRPTGTVVAPVAVVVGTLTTAAAAAVTVTVAASASASAAAVTVVTVVTVGRRRDCAYRAPERGLGTDCGGSHVMMGVRCTDAGRARLNAGVEDEKDEDEDEDDSDSAGAANDEVEEEVGVGSVLDARAVEAESTGSEPPLLPSSWSGLDVARRRRRSARMASIRAARAADSRCCSSTRASVCRRRERGVVGSSEAAAPLHDIELAREGLGAKRCDSGRWDDVGVAPVNDCDRLRPSSAYPPPRPVAVCAGGTVVQLGMPPPSGSWTRPGPASARGRTTWTRAGLGGEAARA